jgi:hypothetical protein
MNENFVRGDFVRIERDRGACMQAMVTLASDNGNSLVLMFDGMFDGYIGMMPVLRSDGEFRDLVRMEIVKITRMP